MSIHCALSILPSFELTLSTKVLFDNTSRCQTPPQRSAPATKAGVFVCWYIYIGLLPIGLLGRDQRRQSKCGPHCLLTYILCIVINWPV
jgi:hypothetical protein